MCFHSQHSRVDLRQKAVMHEAVVEEMGDKMPVVNYYTYERCTTRWKTVQEYVLPSTHAPRPCIFFGIGFETYALDILRLM